MACFKLQEEEPIDLCALGIFSKSSNFSSQNVVILKCSLSNKPLVKDLLPE